MRQSFILIFCIGLINYSFAFQNFTQNNSLTNLYLTSNFGVINYDYNHSLLAEGYRATNIRNTNTFAGRFSVGYHLTDNWDVEFSVMRPANWVQYDFGDPPNFDKSVWTNIWAISSRRNFKSIGLSRIYLELGISNVARKGFTLNNDLVIPSIRYLYPILGAGIYYPITSALDGALTITSSPANKKYHQPSTTFIAGGIIFNVNEPSKAVLTSYRKSIYFFPDHLFHVGHMNDLAGFNINKQFSSGLNTSIPIFWLGDVLVKDGFSTSYQKNIFHTRKNFSFSAGTSLSFYNTLKGDSFFALSIFPVVKWWFLRTKIADLYFNYSVVGPAYISSHILDGIDTGEASTFQDFMGIGFLFGKNRNYNLDFRITHYSNGNIFNENPGIAVPFGIYFGYALY